MSDKGGWVYRLTNRPNGVLYTGVTAELARRVWQHRTKETPGFASAYNATMLVYFERHEEIISAIAREKTSKKWRRAWKVAMIEKTNPAWRDLYDDIL
jgi:putative endonuclease